MLYQTRTVINTRFDFTVGNRTIVFETTLIISLCRNMIVHGQKTLLLSLAVSQTLDFQPPVPNWVNSSHAYIQIDTCLQIKNMLYIELCTIQNNLTLYRDSWFNKLCLSFWQYITMHLGLAINVAPNTLYYSMCLEKNNTSQQSQ